MRHYTITPVHTASPVWTEVPVLEVDNVQWLPDAGIRMTQQVCYDADNLYVRQQAWERDIRAQRTGYLQQVCEDSCMEFFFAPGRDDRYFNMEINPNGCIHLGFGPGRHGRVQVVPKQMEQLFDVHAERTEDGWALTYRIPLSFLRLFFPECHFAPGVTLRANCYKCGDLTAQPHYITWNPVTSETPDYHRPQDFGLMIFG